MAGEHNHNHAAGGNQRSLAIALALSVMLGHASAVTALARFGSAARGDPI